MLGPAIRWLGSKVYSYPDIPQDQPMPGRYGQLKIALVTDAFTASCLSQECRVRCVTPQNYREVLDNWKPDLLFVESVFHGSTGAWRYEVAIQPRWLRLNQPQMIFQVIAHAKSCGIPTVFWNKDDGAYFEPFIHVAKVFDYIFTTDSSCVERYRQQVSAEVPVNVLSMPYQPAFHQFTGFNFTKREACFTGSYYRNILNERAKFLNMTFEACEAVNLPMNIYDRNSDRMSRAVEFRFPKHSQLHVLPKVSHEGTAAVYKSHVVSLNVNSVTNSDTMVSRRLLEILACGGIAVTNPGDAVQKHFAPYCHIVSTPEETTALFSRLREGPTSKDLEMARAGSLYVQAHHTWTHRLDEIADVVSF